MRLIVHAGAGKTGSTSIQQTLKKNDTHLQELGVWYLGLMLERANNKLFEWQREASGLTELARLSNDEAKEQLLKVLRPIIMQAEEKNVHTLIWSNESFCARKSKHNFMGALQQLQKEGVEVDILIYVREYASWLRSAYIQWGIKHKTYPGKKLRTFSEWIECRPPDTPAFFIEIKRLLAKMPEAVKVRNMSATEDVVIDFLEFAEIEIDGVQIARINDAPQSEELFMRALFNSNYSKGAIPEEFDSNAGQHIPSSKSAKEYLDALLPSKHDLEHVLRENSDNREALNQLLLSQGQKILKSDEVLPKTTEIDSEKLILALSAIVMNQSVRISRLEKL